MIGAVEMPTFHVPIEGLTVPADWAIGPVFVRPAAEALKDARDGQEWGVDRIEKVVAEQASGAIAVVVADDIDTALDLISQAIDVLRVLQHVRHFTSQLTQFGIAGDVSHGVVAYLRTDGEQRGQGFSRRGEAIGWAFSDPDEWVNAPAFQWAAGAIGAVSPGESRRRALIGIQLLSQSLLEQRGTFKMVELVGALEAWLLPRQVGGQTFRLARAIAFFGCGRHDGDLCGRSRDTCPYLQLNPGIEAERRKLKRLQAKGEMPPWRCSEWHRVVDWYDNRSEVVHGSGPVISYKEASSALYWVCRYLAEPILQWLADHETEPVEALESEMAALPPGPDWEALLGSQI
jgi:hypothetical protein